MASEKMFPISAILHEILHELKRHCNTSDAVRRAIDREQNLAARQLLESGWECENISIGTLCDLLEIATISDEERSAVITVVSELAAMKGSHLVLGGLLESLGRP